MVVRGVFHNGRIEVYRVVEWSGPAGWPLAVGDFVLLAPSAGATVPGCANYYVVRLDQIVAVFNVRGGQAVDTPLDDPGYLRSVKGVGFCPYEEVAE